MLETLIKFDKLVVRAQETTYEHSILSHKLKEQKRVETDIITLRRQKNVSMQALRAEQGHLPLQERVEVEEDENHFREKNQDRLMLNKAIGIESDWTNHCNSCKCQNIATFHKIE